MSRRPKTQLVLSPSERAQLEALTLRRKTAQAVALRARIVLGCAAGAENKAVAARQRVSEQTVCKWRARFVEHRLDGLLDAPRPGAPRTIDDARVDAVIAKTLESVPDGATHWSTRSMAREAGLSQTAVSRIWRAFGLQPHRQETFKLSSDPLFVDKVRDIVGLYLDPPLKAMVLCVDEKSQIQALDRTQPLLPLARASPSGALTITRATARRRCLPRSTSPPARSSASFTADTAAANSCSSCAPSRPTWHRRWMSTS
jgi:transposase